MAHTIPNEDVKELLGYLKNIKSYEKEYQLSEASTITMIWGLFIMLAGLTDLNVALWTGISPSPFPWFGAITCAFIAQQIVSSQPLLFEKGSDTTEGEMVRNNVSTIEVIITTILMLGTFIISSFALELVMPYIGIVFGSVNLIGRIRNRHIKQLSPESFLIIGAFYLSALITIIGGYFISETFFIFAGFSFGILVGGVTFYRGYQNRKLLIEEEVDISPNDQDTD